MNSFSDTAPRYQPEGWTHWPDHPAWSQQFVRILGATQEGAGTVGECLLAASRMVPGDASSWHREWQRVAQDNGQRADDALAAGHAVTARGHHLRASNYHRVSELFLEPGDARRATTFREVVRHSHAHLRLMSPPGEVLSITLGDGRALDAYLLMPAPNASAIRPPVVIAFGGLDGCKEEMVQRMASAALGRGLALLAVDMPGQGEALRFRGMANCVDTAVAVAHCVDYLQARRDVDADRIALYGASLGGVFAACAAAGETRLKAIVSDSLVFDLHAMLADRLVADGGSGDWKFLQWVFGCDSPAAVVEKCLQLRLAEVVPLIRCPYLIVQGAHDFLGLQTALDAFEHARRHDVPVELRVFNAEETGASHCQADNPSIGQAFICDWLADQLEVLSCT